MPASIPKQGEYEISHATFGGGGCRLHIIGCWLLPLAAGVAALMLSRRPDFLSFEAPVDTVRKVLYNSAEDQVGILWIPKEGTSITATYG